MRRHLPAKHLRIGDRLSTTGERVKRLRTVEGSAPLQIEVTFAGKEGERVEVFDASQPRMCVEV